MAYSSTPTASASLSITQSGYTSSDISITKRMSLHDITHAAAPKRSTGLKRVTGTLNCGDGLLIFDTSASALKKIQKSNIATTLTYTSGTGTGDGSTTAFTINSGRSVNDVLVVVNGITMVPTTDYQISGTTLTFQGSAPASGAEIVFRYI